MLEQAESEDSDDKRIEAHTSLCDSYFWLGQVSQAKSHALLGLSLYDFELHHESHTLEYGEDPSGLMLCYLCLAQLILGQNDEAKQSVQTSLSSLNQFTHAFSQGFLLIGLAWYYNHSRMPEQGQKYAAQLLELAEANDFSPWVCAAKIQLGWSNSILDGAIEATEMMREGIEFWCTYGGITPSWMTYSMLIDAYINSNDLDSALAEIEAAQRNLRNSEEKLFYSEVLRQRANVLIKIDGDPEEIIKLYNESIKQAQSQQAQIFVQRTNSDMHAYLNDQSQPMAIHEMH